MYLTSREASTQFGANVHVFPDMASLYAFECASPAAVDLLVVEGALATPALRVALGDPSWPKRIVEGLRLPEGHRWLFTGRPGESGDDQRLVPGDLELISAAAGTAGPPRGSIRCTWWIRRYDERRSTDGDLDFFARMQAAGGQVDPVADAIIAALSDLLVAAAACGGTLLVEQLTVILAKDPGARLRTLTPTLHADEYYGRRETAIASLTEDGWSRRGGALFLPALRMAELEARGRFELARVESELAGELVVTPGSGDLLIYDGMRGPDGMVDRRQGVPHISADVPGQSARLVVLMRHALPGAVRPGHV